MGFSETKQQPPKCTQEEPAIDLRVLVSEMGCDQCKGDKDMMERPRLRIQLATLDKVLEILGWLIIVSLWIVVIFLYQSLPETISTHSAISGKTNGHGDKLMLLIRPALATAIVVSLTILNKFPQVFNYPVPIDNHNALRYYTSATRLVRVVKITVAAAYSLICVTSILAVAGKSKDLAPMSVPIVLGSVLIPILIYAAIPKRKG